MAAARRLGVRAALGFAAALACLVPHEALAMNASFSWAGIAPCKRVSPAFVIEDAPAGTKRLRFMMHDEDAPHFHHGGSTVAYTGSKVPQGAISYVGPCPPEGEAHHYVWTIEALDAKGHVLAKTTVNGDFPIK